MYSPKKRAWSLLIECKQHNALQSSQTQDTYLKTGATPFTQTAAVQRIKKNKMWKSPVCPLRFTASLRTLNRHHALGHKQEKGTPERWRCSSLIIRAVFKDSRRYNPQLSRKSSAFRGRRRTWSCARKKKESLFVTNRVKAFKEPSTSSPEFVISQKAWKHI